MILINKYIEMHCQQNIKIFCLVSVLISKAFRSVMFSLFLEFEEFINCVLSQYYLHVHIFITNTYHTCHVAISVLQVTFCNICMCIRS